MGKQIEVYVPVKVGKVLCHSRLLDDIGDFTRYMIWAIGNNYTEQLIKATIQLDEIVVEEALCDLERWKFAKRGEEEGRWELTAGGKEYFELIRCMEKLENKEAGFDCCVELCHGQVELAARPVEVVDEVPQGAFQLESKIVDFFLLNDNYENSLQIVQEKLKEEGLLEQQYMGSLYTTLKLEKKTKYRRYKTPPYDLNAVENTVDKGDFRFAVPIAYLEYRRYCVALDEYRTVLDTLEKLRIFEQQRTLSGGAILSENALEILDTYEREKAMPDMGIYLDEYTGEVIGKQEKEEESRIKLTRRADEKRVLSARHQVEFRKNDNWRYELVRSDKEGACPVEFQFSELLPIEEENHE